MPPVLALPLGGCWESSGDPLGYLSSYDLGPSRDGVWEVFNSGPPNGRVKKAGK